MLGPLVTYPELEQHIDVFVNGPIKFMIIEGAPGNGKSSMVKQKLKAIGKVKEKDFLWLEGRLTAAAFYDQLSKHRDLPVIIDDVDGLYSNKECVNILKCLCQTDTEKHISWNTVTKIEQGREGFMTKSKVCIITNSWKALNKHVDAVGDRGTLLTFRPPAEEIHRYVKESLGDNAEVFSEEVYEFIGKYLTIIKKPSIRNYILAKEYMPTSIDWRGLLITSFGLTDEEVCVLKLSLNKELSGSQRADEFARILKKSDRTYWRFKADLEAKGIKFDK